MLCCDHTDSVRVCVCVVCVWCLSHRTGSDMSNYTLLEHEKVGTHCIFLNVKVNLKKNLLCLLLKQKTMYLIIIYDIICVRLKVPIFFRLNSNLIFFVIRNNDSIFIFISIKSSRYLVVVIFRSWNIKLNSLNTLGLFRKIKNAKSYRPTVVAIQPWFLRIERLFCKTLRYKEWGDIYLYRLRVCLVYNLKLPTFRAKSVVPKSGWKSLMFFFLYICIL